MNGGAAEAVFGFISFFGLLMIPVGLLVAGLALERRSRENGARLARIEVLLKEQVELMHREHARERQ